jgi:transaldolase
VDLILEWGKEFLTENKDKTEMKKMININPTKSIKEAEVVIRIIDELKIIIKTSFHF